VVEIKEMGYRPEPYVLADAHMYADGDYIVFFKDMSLQMTGLSQSGIEDFWRRRGQPNRPPAPAQPPVLAANGPKPPLFTRAHILEFAQGRPSKAFGEPYVPFDDQRRIARLPAPPYCFMDRVTAIEPEPWVVKADGWVEAQYDMRADDWYFAADRSGVMPFCILLEIALQPCGWLAAYVGSALRSRQDLKFRNLGGQATLYENLLPADRTLTMRARISKVSEAADMIIENFDFEVHDEERPVYSGTTYFGFFTAQALAQQVGLREAVYRPDEDIHQAGTVARLADEAPLVPDDVQPGAIHQPQGLVMPAKALRMIDSIDLFQAKGGPHGLGYVRGRKQVDPSEWFFKAHFFQDPVCPGSLGVESFLQLIKYAAMQRWPELRDSRRFEMVCGQAHEWQYRGQVVPTNSTVTVEAVITRVTEGLQPLIVADGWLQVDGLYIYKMVGFGLRLVAV
jgi:3-hydroxymyristoyl/3-hydroxydecanoyl-(acyl carrier protein) dehydratase